MPASRAEEEFEVLALNALTFLADSPPELARFLALSGIDPQELRRTAGETEFLGGVIDFFLSDDTLLARFCTSRALDPRAVHAARRGLASRARGRD